MKIQKKTKIVATIGPSTSSEEKLAALLKAGLDVARLNFSHGDFAEHQIKVDNLHSAIAKTGIQCAILQDLAGPKIRIGDFKVGSIVLKEGQEFTLTTNEAEGDETRVSVNYPKFAQEVSKGHTVFLHDGRLQLEVIDVKGNDVVCKVIVGGEIKGRRGVNLPHSELSIASMTEKDHSDIEFGIKNQVDFFALSFVRRPSDVEELRNVLNARKCRAKIIVKIETPQALANIDEILKLTDGVMVARGDLAIEIPAENVPIAQKMIISKCNDLGKPVITATQMLESMIDSPVPTRAEVSDIANAIFDGTDAIMLSEETALGQFPVESVKMMARVALKVESDHLYTKTEKAKRHMKGLALGVVDAVTSEAVDVADRTGAKCIVALTHSGFTAAMVARYKPAQPLIAFTPDEIIARQLLLSYGCIPTINKNSLTFNDAMEEVRKFVLENKVAKKGDKVVVVAGAPFNTHGVETNLMLVETV
jgi:pyruvate kinase